MEVELAAENQVPTLAVSAPIEQFDYSALEPNLIERMQRAANNIKHHGEQVSIGILQIGKELHSIKKMLGHGNFGDWIRLEFGFDERTARRFMLAAERLGGISDIVSVLTPTQLYDLSAAPAAVAEIIVERLRHGEKPAPREIRQLSQDERSRQAAQKRQESLTPEQLRRERTAERIVPEEQQQDAECREPGRKQGEAADEFVLLLFEGLPGQVPRLVDLLETAGYSRLASLLRSLGGETGPVAPTIGHTHHLQAGM